jgi:hypothetical protein
MIPMEQSVATILDETIEALSQLDHDRLSSLEKKIQMLANTDAVSSSTPSVLERQQTLKYLLDETKANVAVLTRLHHGNGGSEWER